MASKLSIAISCVAILATVTTAVAVDEFPQHQQPLAHHGDSEYPMGDESNGLIKKLIQAKIIPSVLDTFTPQLTLALTWSSHISAQLGNTIAPSEMQNLPSVSLTPLLSSTENPARTNKPPPQLTLAITDPDAPSHVNPKWSQVCHWIATQLDPHTLNLTDIMPYKPPGPPPKTGKHRYVMVVLAPLNGTRERLALRKPTERFHWGYDGKGEERKGRDGLRVWAAEMGLGVVGANFIYAQNEKQ